MRYLVALVLLVGCAPTALERINSTIALDGKPVGETEWPTLVIVFASWCQNCGKELFELEALQRHHVRLLGVNYRGHEEYDGRGNSKAVRSFADAKPWLRVVPIGDATYKALGSPSKIPTLYLFDQNGTLIETYDRRDRRPPTRDELTQALARLGS